MYKSKYGEPLLKKSILVMIFQDTSYNNFIMDDEKNRNIRKFVVCTLEQCKLAKLGMSPIFTM